MEIGLTDIRYILNNQQLYCAVGLVENKISLIGYKVSFLINDLIKSQMVINTDGKELTMAEIKIKIKETLEG